MVERAPEKREVDGSMPSPTTKPLVRGLVRPLLQPLKHAPYMREVTDMLATDDDENAWSAHFCLWSATQMSGSCRSRARTRFTTSPMV